MHSLLIAVTAVRWRALAVAVWPALACSALCAAGVWLAGRGVQAVSSATKESLLVFIGQGAAASLLYLVFVLLVPVAAVRVLIAEMYDDLVPVRFRKSGLLNRLIYRHLQGRVG